MDTHISIGQNSTRRVTKDELFALINATFPDDQYSTIAVVTTTYWGDYHNPTIMQSVTFGKPLADGTEPREIKT